MSINRLIYNGMCMVIKMASQDFIIDFMLVFFLLVFFPLFFSLQYTRLAFSIQRKGTRPRAWFLGVVYQHIKFRDHFLVISGLLLKLILNFLGVDWGGPQTLRRAPGASGMVADIRRAVHAGVLGHT